MTKKKIDVHDTSSDKKGLIGLLESFARKYKGIGYVLGIVPTSLAYVFCISFATAPVYLIFRNTLTFIDNLTQLYAAILFGFATAVAIGVWSICLMFAIIVCNKIIPLKKKNWRGNVYSLELIPWFYHNALVMLARYTVLNFYQSTPVINMFYKGMGMKVGRGCVINTTNIQDPCLITLEEFVTIGGSATIFCHYAQAGFIVLAPVHIKKGATVGLKASIMGDVIVNEKATVTPHSVLLPKTRYSRDNNSD